MSAINDAREELKQTLVDAGLAAFTHAPSQFSPPGVVIQSTSDFIQPAGFGGLFTVRFELYLLVKEEHITTLTEKSDAMIETVVGALDDWTIQEVSGLETWQFTDTDRVFVGSRVICTTEIQF